MSAALGDLDDSSLSDTDDDLEKKFIVLEEVSTPRNEQAFFIYKIKTWYVSCTNCTTPVYRRSGR